jgi:hypothetical protein
VTRMSLGAFVCGDSIQRRRFVPLGPAWMLLGGHCSGGQKCAVPLNTRRMNPDCIEPVLDNLLRDIMKTSVPENMADCWNEPDFGRGSAAALNKLFGKEKSDRVVLLDQTSMGFPPGMAARTNWAARLRPCSRDFPKEAKDDFDSRNKAQARIERGKIKTA